MRLLKSRRSAVGSALRSGRKGRGFESRRLDQNSHITVGGTAVFDSTACDGIRGWEPFCGSKTLCLTELGKGYSLTAKDDVNNVGAGRAAKGANPVASTKNTV